MTTNPRFQKGETVKVSCCGFVWKGVIEEVFESGFEISFLEGNAAASLYFLQKKSLYVDQKYVYKPHLYILPPISHS